MAAFSTMALLGGGLLAGAAATKLLTRNKKDDQQLAPGPTTPDPNALAPPAPPIVNPADANAQATAAATRQRKRTARGSLLTNPQAPVSNAMPVAPRYARPTLLGS